MRTPPATVLQQYIREHGHKCGLSAGGALMVLALWTKDDMTGETWETIPATLRAVRAWLGY